MSQNTIEALIAERDAIKLQAQCWKCEANAQKATVQEIYQLCTGATGEPGDWNGAEPVRKLIAERDALQAQLAAAQGQSLPILQVSAFVEGFLDEVEEPPERNCRCHISPPCNDCVDHSCLRELFLDARRLVKTIAELGAAPIPQQVAEPSVPKGWKQAVALAYGHLWHVNNEPMAPVPLRSSETAAYEARKQLRDLLTHEERGLAINQVQVMLAAAPQPKEPK